MSDQPGLVTAVIDGREVRAAVGTTILRAAESIGISIPVFCYHPKLAPAGACRICLVEVEKIPKPVTACSTELGEGMVVRTNTPSVLKARAQIMELLLINHPLDCPVCDKGGECMLQDNSYFWGGGKVRFTEERRRFVKPVPLSDRILLDRERCIMCTRCVRFCAEISDHRRLTVAERGGESIIAVAPGGAFDSQFSGNTTEICPVGALTATQFRFKARPWELRVTRGICPFCGCGCNIYINTRSGKILRFMSRENSGIDEGWLCDRGRYGFEHINSPDRLKTPMVRRNGRLIETTWEDAVSTVVSQLRRIRDQYGGGAAAGIGSAWATSEENERLQLLIRDSLMSPHIDCSLSGDGRPLALALSEGLGDFKITDIDGVDTVMLLGADPSLHQPIIELRLKKAVKTRDMSIIAFHVKDMELSRYSRSFIKYRAGEEEAFLRLMISAVKKEKGGSAQTGDEVSAGVSRERLDKAAGMLIQARKCLILTDESLMVNDVRVYLLKELRALLGENTSTGVLFKSCNGFGALRSGAVSGYLPGFQRSVTGMCGHEILSAAGRGEIKALYLLGIDSDDANALARARKGAELIICHSMFMNEAAAHADVIFPGAAFCEKDGTITNTAGVAQAQAIALNPPGSARSEAVVMDEIRKRMG